MSVGWLVGWSVTHSFDDPDVAPIGLLVLVFLKIAMKIMISPGNFSKMHKCVHERFEENSDLIVFNLGSSVNELQCYVGEEKKKKTKRRK